MLKNHNTNKNYFNHRLKLAKNTTNNLCQPEISVILSQSD